MTWRRKLLLAALFLVVMPWTTAQAGVRVAVGIGWPYYRPYYYRPVYVAPVPVYVAPAPVYVVPGQAPVYVQAAPPVVQSPTTADAPTMVPVPPPPPPH
jgi:hypothetical protein